MPDEEQKQPPQQPTEGESTPVRRDYSVHNDTARDGETQRASGARPSPNPEPDPKAPEGPVNRAADLTEVVHFANSTDVDTATRVQATDAPPPPPPATDSSEGEA